MVVDVDDDGNDVDGSLTDELSFSPDDVFSLDDALSSSSRISKQDNSSSSSSGLFETNEDTSSSSFGFFEIDEDFSSSSRLSELDESVSSSFFTCAGVNNFCASVHMEVDQHEMSFKSSAYSHDMLVFIRYNRGCDFFLCFMAKCTRCFWVNVIVLTTVKKTVIKLTLLHYD